MAKSNLRKKGPQFNFGLAAGFSESNGEEEEKSEQEIDFYNQGKPQSDSDEEMNLHLQTAKTKVNPFANRMQAQKELQPSQIRKNERAANKLKMQNLVLEESKPMETEVIDSETK